MAYAALLASPSPAGPCASGAYVRVPTPLVLARALSARLPGGRLWLKLEGHHASGSHKGRAAEAIVAAAATAGAGGVAVGSCGSIGVALALEARRQGLSCVVHVPDRYRGAPRGRILTEGARVVPVDGGYEEAVMASRALARAWGLYDANPNGPGGTVSIEAYGAIAREIVAQLGRVPDTVWVPCGNGTTIAGIHAGFRRMGRGGPRMGAAGSPGNTALTASVRAGREVELDGRAMVETRVNEPLLNRRSFHVVEGLATVVGSGGWAVDVSDAGLLVGARLVARLEGIACMPASAAAVMATLRTATEGLLPPGDHVAVLTARPL